MRPFCIYDGSYDMTISSYVPNRFVQVHNVLDGKVAHVEGEYVFAKSMQKLDVVQGIRHRRWIPQCQIAPGQIVRTI